jgi:hypothetical protein
LEKAAVEVNHLSHKKGDFLVDYEDRTFEDVKPESEILTNRV